MPSKPMFNVVEPFEEAMVIQMNRSMAELLQEFLFDIDDLECELYELAEALTDFRRFYRRETDVEFSVDVFGNMIILILNYEMQMMLEDFINSIEGHVEVEIRALSRAIKDPEGCYRIRKSRKNYNGAKNQAAIS